MWFVCLSVVGCSASKEDPLLMALADVSGAECAGTPVVAHPLQDSTATTVTPHEGLLYVTGIDLSTEADVFQIFDASDLDGIRLRGEVEFGVDTIDHHVAVQGSVAAVLYNELDETQLAVFDVANPGRPTLLSQLSLGDPSEEVHGLWVGTQLLLSVGDIDMVDLSDPRQPVPHTWDGFAVGRAMMVDDELVTTEGAAGLASYEPPDGDEPPTLIAESPAFAFRAEHGLAASSRGVLAAGFVREDANAAALVQPGPASWEVTETLTLPWPEVGHLHDSVDHDGSLALLYATDERDSGVLLLDAEEGLEVAGGWRPKDALLHTDVASDGDLTWVSVITIAPPYFNGLVALDWSACR
jgi:hypothetical protein